MRKIYCHKKAVSPVIATILMIMVCLIGMSLVFAFVTFYTQNYQNGVGSSVLESLTIEHVWFLNESSSPTSYGNSATIWVYNSGDIDATINAIYINGAAATNGTSNFNFNIPILVGQHISITVQGPYWQSNVPFEFTVSTTRGSTFEETFTPT